MQAFVVRPFGKKGEIDFEQVHKELIAPALEASQIVGGTTALIFEAGNIREDMFQLLLLADLVVADISIPNANVYYELGIRHALRSRQTFLIRAKVTKPRAERGPDDEVPFDLKTDRYLEYDHTKPGNSLNNLVMGLLATKRSDRVDSPVFRSLPSLTEPDRDKLNPVPLDFSNDVERAAALKEKGKLGLLAWEARAYRWESGALRLIGEQQFQLSLWKPAKETWEGLRNVYPDDIQANLALGTIYQRLNDLVASGQLLERVKQSPIAKLDQRSEALALQARNEKAIGRAAWKGKTVRDRRIAALQSKRFQTSADLYTLAFQQDLNHYYSGLNALSLLTLLLDLIGIEPQTWQDTFDSEEEANLHLKEMNAARQRLTPTVDLSLRAARAKTKGNGDPWLTISEADFKFLTVATDRDAAVAAAYGRAIEGVAPFVVSAAQAQLELFRELDLRTDRVNACLAIFPLPAPPQDPLRQVILFTGHMIDKEGREKPRFPKELEGKARESIHRRVNQLLNDTPGPALGIAGGANGGDMLFHEVCRELGVPTQVLLTLPPGLFIAESVAGGGPGWIKRFNELLETHPDTQILGDSKELPRWMGPRSDYDVWQRTNIWILTEALASGAPNTSLVALWDGRTGDGPGGTKHMVELAKKDYGLNVLHIPMDELRV
jgi:hypothetical protein